MQLFGAGLMLPDSDDSESGLPQFSAHALSAESVAPELLDPIRPITARQRARAPRTTVPEAPVDKDDDLLRWEHEVGDSSDRTDVHFPSANARAHKHRSDAPLGRAIALRANPAHAPATFGPGENVHTAVLVVEYRRKGL